MPNPKAIGNHFQKSGLLSDLTSEGVHVPGVRCDGVQVNTAAALSLHMVTVVTCTENVMQMLNIYSAALSMLSMASKLTSERA